MKIVENDCYYLFFLILEPLFKLSGSKPLKKQNKTKNIDLLNAHFKTEQFIGKKYFVIFNIVTNFSLFVACLFFLYTGDVFKSNRPNM